MVTRNTSFFILISFILTGCQSFNNFEYIKFSGNTQGTTYHITYENNIGRDLSGDIDSVLRDFSQSLSTYIPNSVISRINNNIPSAAADYHFLKVYEKSREVYENTGGAFDVTVAPLVNAWGFGFTGKSKIDSSFIDSLLVYTGMDKVKLDGDKIIKSNSNTMFDFNAIAQGYSVDVVGDFLEGLGIKNYMVEIGGELKAKGKNPKNELWKVGIDKPIENNNIPGSSVQSIMTVKNKSLATSGNYRKFFEENGKKYSHFIDPKTGYAVYSDILSATVVTEDCMTADAYATAFMVMGKDKTLEYLKKNKYLQAYLIYSDAQGNFQTFMTSRLKKWIREQ